MEHKDIKEAISSEEEKYLVKERAEADVNKHGSVSKALEALREELEDYESLWSMYSSECLGHAITCTRYKISFLERTFNNIN